MAFNPKRALEKAEKFAAKGQHDKAAREYQAVVDANPKDVRAWLMLADCLVRCGQQEKAIDRYLRVATFYADGKQPEKALAVYRQILNVDPSRLDIHTKVGKLNQEMGRIGDAVACYEAVAQAKLKAGHIQEALKVYELVAEADSRSLSKRLRLAELYSREKMLSQAVENFRIAARQLLAAEKYEDYIRVAERLVYHKESDTQTLRNLARAYMKTGEPRRALVKLNALLHLDQADVGGLELLAEAFIALEKPEKAVRVVGELAREFNKRGPEGKQDALRVLDRGLQWDPDCDELRALRAEVDQGATGGLRDVADSIEELDDGDVEELGDSDFEELGDDEVMLEGLPEDGGVRPPDTEMSEVAGPSAPDAGAGVEGSGETDKMLAEVQTYLKYRLLDHALAHLELILDMNPRHPGATKLHAEVLTKLGRKDEAAAVHAKLAAQAEEPGPKLAEKHARRAIEQVPGHDAARALPTRMSSRGEPDEADFSELAGGSRQDAKAAPKRSVVGDSEMFEVDFDDDAPSQQPDAVSSELPSMLGFSGDDAATFDELEASDSLEAARDSIEADNRRDEPDFAIHLQESEPSNGLEVPEPVAVEDRFGLSDDGESETETPEAEEELLGPEDELVRTEEVVVDELLGAAEAEEELLGPEEVPEELLLGPGEVPEELLLGAAEAEDVEPGVEEAEEEELGPEEVPEELLPGAEEAEEEEPQDWPDIEDDVAEIRFYMAQEIMEDAELAFDDLQRRHPDHPEVIALGEEIAPMRTPLEDGEEAARPLVELEEEDEDANEYLSAIFGDAPPAAEPKPAVEPQARAVVEDADAATLFDLGTAYVEMGLVDDAITQLTAAAADEQWKAKSLVMLASLRARRGETEEAILSLREAIDAAKTPDEACEARYELSLLYEQVGDTAQALELLEAVESGYRDREKRLTQLRDS